MEDAHKRKQQSHAIKTFAAKANPTAIHMKVSREDIAEKSFHPVEILLKYSPVKRKSQGARRAAQIDR